MCVCVCDTELMREANMTYTNCNSRNNCVKWWCILVKMGTVGWITSEKCKTRAKLMRKKWNDNNNNNNKDKETSISNDLVHGFTKSNTFFAFILRFFFPLIPWTFGRNDRQLTILFKRFLCLFLRMKNNPNNLLSTGRDRDIERARERERKKLPKNVCFAY